MHVHAIGRVARSYEHINPEAVGNSRRVLVSDMSGRTNILMKAGELGFKLDPEAPETRAITAEVKRLEGLGYEYEAAEGSLALLIRKLLKHQEPPFKIEGYHVSNRRDKSISVCQASVKVLVDGVTEHTIAEGDGPINALDGALRAALVKFFPQLKKVHLEDYKVRILDSSAGTGSRTRVLIESTDGKEDWGTVGVHDNIIEASLQALAESLEYRLTKK
jgi:2-isopropylmalate synthase